MITKTRVEKILDLVKKEYDYMDNKPIYILINNFGRWCTETVTDYYNLILNKEFKDDNFTLFFYNYLAEEFNFDVMWAREYYKTTMEALALLHEIGHIQQTMNMKVDERYIKIMNKAYKDYRKKSYENKKEKSIAYRKISYEYLADKFAVDMFNKYAVKILAILNNTTQKEIKNKLVEAKRKIA